MNRRQFFVALTALGASAQLASSLLDAADLKPSPVILEPDEWTQLVEVQLVGCENESRAAIFSVVNVENNQPFFTQHFNANGGAFLWRAPAGYGIILHKSRPIRVEANFDGVFRLVTQRAGHTSAVQWEVARNDGAAFVAPAPRITALC